MTKAVLDVETVPSLFCPKPDVLGTNESRSEVGSKSKSRVVSREVVRVDVRRVGSEKRRCFEEGDVFAGNYACENVDDVSLDVCGIVC